MEMIIVGILYFAGCIMFAGLGIWYLHLALSCKHMVNATLMKKEYRSARRYGIGCTLHFHVKGEQAKRYIISNVFYWIGNRMVKHQKYNIYVSSDGKRAVLSRFPYLLAGILWLSAGIFGIWYAISILLF